MVLLPMSMWRWHGHGWGICISLWEDPSGNRHWVRIGFRQRGRAAMFDLLKNATRAVVGVAVLPIDVVADVVTLGGELTDQRQSYTGKRLDQIGAAIDDVVEG